MDQVVITSAIADVQSEISAVWNMILLLIVIHTSQTLLC